MKTCKSPQSEVGPDALVNLEADLQHSCTRLEPAVYLNMLADHSSILTVGTSRNNWWKHAPERSREGRMYTGNVNEKFTF